MKSVAEKGNTSKFGVRVLFGVRTKKYFLYILYTLLSMVLKVF